LTQSVMKEAIVGLVQMEFPLDLTNSGHKHQRSCLSIKGLPPSAFLLQFSLPLGFSSRYYLPTLSSRFNIYTEISTTGLDYTKYHPWTHQRCSLVNRPLPERLQLNNILSPNTVAGGLSKTSTCNQCTSRQSANGSKANDSC
jgi:hypothetical protein